MTRGAVRGGARGAPAPTEIRQWVRRTPPQNEYLVVKRPIYKKSYFTIVEKLKI